MMITMVIFFSRALCILCIYSFVFVFFFFSVGRDF